MKGLIILLIIVLFISIVLFVLYQSQGPTKTIQPNQNQTSANSLSQNQISTNPLIALLTYKKIINFSIVSNFMVQQMASSNQLNISYSGYLIKSNETNFNVHFISGTNIWVTYTKYNNNSKLSLTAQLPTNFTIVRKDVSGNISYYGCGDYGGYIGDVCESENTTSAPNLNITGLLQDLNIINVGHHTPLQPINMTFIGIRSYKGQACALVTGNVFSISKVYNATTFSRNITACISEKDYLPLNITAANFFNSPNVKEYAVVYLNETNNGGPVNQSAISSLPYPLQTSVPLFFSDDRFLNEQFSYSITPPNSTDLTEMFYDGNIIMKGIGNMTYEFCSDNNICPTVGPHNLTAVDVTTNETQSIPLVILNRPAVSIIPVPVDNQVLNPTKIGPHESILLIANASGGTSHFSFQWYNTTTVRWLPIPNAKTVFLEINSSLPGTFKYSVVLLDNGIIGSPLTSIASVNITVYKKLNASLFAFNNTFLQGKPISIRSNVIGGSGNFTYQWFNVTNGYPIQMVNQSSANLALIANRTGSFYYSLNVKDNTTGETVTTQAFLIHVLK